MTPFVQYKILTRNELLLLRAAIYRGPVSLAAWDELKFIDNLDSFGPGAIYLLPELYISLTEQGINHHLLPRLRGVYKHTWAHNQLMFARARDILIEFHKRDIPTMLMKGAALTLQHYRDFGRRFMLDVDVMVPHEQAVEAFNTLLEIKWRPKERVPQPLSCLFISQHGIGFEAPSAPVSLDLHWNALHLSLGPGIDDPFWKRRVPIEFLDVDTFVLNPTDQLLQVLAHACNWWVPYPICWVRDALTMIMKSGEYPIDWARLDQESRRHSITLGIHDKLQYLRQHFGVEIPEFVCNSNNVSFYQRVENWAYSRPLPYSPFELCLVVLMVFLRLPTDFRAGQGVLALPRFLQFRLGASRLRDVPSVFLKLMRNMGRLKKRLKEERRRRVQLTH